MYTVNHHILVDKLHLCGITNPVLSWFKSYLTNRSWIKVNILSECVSVPCGVGFFLVFISVFIIDIGSCFEFSNHHLFADDLKIYASVSFKGCIEMQTHLDRFCDRCTRYDLKRNTSKCILISFLRWEEKWISNIKSRVFFLGQVATVRDFKVMFPPNFSFTSHV